MIFTLTILAYLLVTLILLVLIAVTVVFRVMLGESWKTIWKELHRLKLKQIPSYFVSSTKKAFRIRRYLAKRKKRSASDDNQSD